MADLTTHKGYMSRVLELAGENQSARDPMRRAFFCVESELRDQHGVRRYTSYGSFMAGKARRPQRARLRPFKTT